MVFSVKTFKYDAWNKANKIITSLHNLVADITLNFPLIILVVKCASIISNSAYIILHCKMFYTFYFFRNMLTSPWLLYLFVCGGVGGWVCVWVSGCVGVCKYTVPPNKDLDVDTQYKRGCTSDQGCPRFPVMPGPGAWEIANSIKMFKTGPQMDNNNDFFFQLSKSTNMQNKISN